MSKQSKTCSRCQTTKNAEYFIKNKNICKECDNKRHNELRKIREQEILKKIEQNETNTCNKCNIEKHIAEFMTGINMCKDCNNKIRREKRLLKQQTLNNQNTTKT